MNIKPKQFFNDTVWQGRIGGVYFSTEKRLTKRIIMLNLDESCRRIFTPNVRLSTREIEVIRATVHRLLGDAARIRIFGSRARLDEKGGDIDILIETEQKLADPVASACRLTSQLQMQLGDQKIDAIIVGPETPEQPIHRIARQTGVML